MPAVLATFDPTHARVLVTERAITFPDLVRPYGATTMASLPDGADPRHARITAVPEVEHGDLVLATFNLRGHSVYFATPYRADLSRIRSVCTCEEHRRFRWSFSHRVLRRGFYGEPCNVHYSHTFLLVIPAQFLPAT
jgi:hypothetical protein